LIAEREREREREGERETERGREREREGGRQMSQLSTVHDEVPVYKPNSYDD